jgi:hypothetical protein
VRFQAPGEGWFAVEVDSRVPPAPATPGGPGADWGCRQYIITAIDVSPPTPTPTRTPGPPPTATPPATAVPAQVMVDGYEPNYDFATAANIGVGQTLNLNFNPYPAGSNAVDNDYFRLYVKVGEKLRIETTNLAPGLDTNLILYRDNGAVIAGNDDCLPGERCSCIEWVPDYTGLAYLLVGPVGTIPEATTAGARAYSLVVTDVAGQTPTPAPGATPILPYGQPLAWPVTPPPAPAMDISMPVITPSPAAEVRVRLLELAPPTSTPRPLQALTLDLTVYYDENDNRSPDASEGVTGLSVRVLDSLDNQLLGQAFTDGNGHANLTVAAPGEVRVSIPYLGYNQAVRPPGKALTIRLTPMRLPSLIP